MAVSYIKETFPNDMQTVWDIVTSLRNCSWRSDLSRIEILDERCFIEYTKNGYQTHFKTTVFESCRRWEFDIENDNMTGHWTGIFSREGNATVIEFTEQVTPKKALMRPFIKLYLIKQQKNYIEDLKKALSKNTT